MSCCMACDVLRYIHETEKMYSQEAAVLLMSRTFLVRAWTEETDMSCTRVSNIYTCNLKIIISVLLRSCILSSF